AREELKVYVAAFLEILTMTCRVFETEDTVLATQVEPLEEVIDALNDEVKKQHIKRLRKGKCTIELGFILSDLTTNFERVADHCSNIAVCMIQTREDGFEAHEYLDNLKVEGNVEFANKYKEYRKKYKLP
ncbi:MAG: PhoU domain-containing protein, partial [Lachnospiraceae bacterium]|nr:PhoU domain-containing protein [Lachnospiraceae bacterium]